MKLIGGEFLTAIIGPERVLMRSWVRKTSLTTVPGRAIAGCKSNVYDTLDALELFQSEFLIDSGVERWFVAVSESVNG